MSCGGIGCARAAFQALASEATLEDVFGMRRLHDAMPQLAAAIAESSFASILARLSPPARALFEVLCLFPVHLAPDAAAFSAGVENDALEGALEQLTVASLVQVVSTPLACTLETDTLVKNVVRSQLRATGRYESITHKARTRYTKFVESNEGKTTCAFTPDMFPVVLPKGATVADFAYAIHTGIGARLLRAVIDGRLFEKDREAPSGKVITLKLAERPIVNEDWINVVSTCRSRRAVGVQVRRIENARSAVHRGNLLSRRGDMRGAEARFREAIALDPNGAWGFNRLGHVLRLMGRLAEAEKAHWQAEALGEGVVHARLGLGAIAYHRGAWHQAERWFRQARAEKVWIPQRIVLAGADPPPNGGSSSSGDDRARALDGLQRTRVPPRHHTEGILWLLRAAGVGGLGRAGRRDQTAPRARVESVRSTLESVKGRSGSRQRPGAVVQQIFPHVVYYFAAALACAGAKSSANWFDIAVKRCNEHGLLREVSLDLQVLQRLAARSRRSDLVGCSGPKGGRRARQDVGRACTHPRSAVRCCG